MKSPIERASPYRSPSPPSPKSRTFKEWFADQQLKVKDWLEENPRFIPNFIVVGVVVVGLMSLVVGWRMELSECRANAATRAQTFVHQAYSAGHTVSVVHNNNGGACEFWVTVDNLRPWKLECSNFEGCYPEISN